MNMKKKRSTPKDGVLVFDLDGTLTDTSEDIAFTINYMRKKLGLSPLSTETVLGSVGKGAAYLLMKLMDVGEDEKERLRELAPEFQRHYLAHQGERAALYPGIKDVLSELAEQYDLYVLSNKPDIATKNELEQSGIGHHFRKVWGAGALAALKPAPDGIEAAMSLSGAPKSKTLMIGDLVVDVLTGINAGVRTIHVTWGFGTLEPDGPQPTASADSAAELASKIRKLI
jgi:phosphoglycolate phosphatase